MDVSKGVVVRIPATKTEVDTTNGSGVVIHDHNFFVVGPELNGIYGEYITEQTPDWTRPNERYLDCRYDQDAS